MTAMTLPGGAPGPAPTAAFSLPHLRYILLGLFTMRRRPLSRRPS